MANFQQSGAKQGKNEFLFGVLWCFLGKIGDQKRQKLRYIWFLRLQSPASILFCGGGGGVHWVQVVLGAVASGVLRCVFSPLLPAVCPLCCTCFLAPVPKYAFICVLRAFLAGFAVLVWVCVALVLCVVCGAFVRVNS